MFHNNLIQFSLFYYLYIYNFLSIECQSDMVEFGKRRRFRSMIENCIWVLFTHEKVSHKANFVKSNGCKAVGCSFIVVLFHLDISPQRFKCPIRFSERIDRFS